jgi:hypothetical protein
MSIIISNVGRRSERWGEKGDPTDVGEFTLNGFEKNLLFWNRGNGVFRDVAFLAGANDVEDARAMAVADFDRDGRLDFLVNHRNQPVALLMASGGSGHWLQLELVGTKSNRDGIGARVFVEAGVVRCSVTTQPPLQGANPAARTWIGCDPTGTPVARNLPTASVRTCDGSGGLPPAMLCSSSVLPLPTRTTAPCTGVPSPASTKPSTMPPGRTSSKRTVAGVPSFPNTVCTVDAA